MNPRATLNLATGASKIFTGSSANNGTVAWSAGDVGLYGNGSVTNTGKRAPVLLPIGARSRPHWRVLASDATAQWTKRATTSR